VEALQPHDTAWVKDANSNLEEVWANYQSKLLSSVEMMLQQSQGDIPHT
jgi:hypothetical protein